jgi:hypothetical protein
MAGGASTCCCTQPRSVSTRASQSAGLIDSIKPAGDVVREIVAAAEEILRSGVSTFP